LDAAGFIEHEFGLRPRIESDANCLALGEARQGAGRNEELLLGAVLGHSLRLGVVAGGRIAGPGTFASQTAPSGHAESPEEQALRGGVQGLFQRISGKEASPKQIGELAEQGDPAALETWRRYGEALGQKLGEAAARAPGCLVVLGGPTARRLPLFREPLEKRIRAVAPGRPEPGTRVTAALLDNAAGVTGAAELALMDLSASSSARAS
jgi:predicted NBD/HSP70 family sugar kinase